MITQQDFNIATSRKRNDMAKRLRAKYWKTGKRAGKLRVPGRELPFTLAEWRAWCMKNIGFGCVPCHYCPRPVDVLRFEPDHYYPLSYGGSAGLENIVVACDDCNGLKGEIPGDDFVLFLGFIEHELSMLAYSDITKRLRAGAMATRLRSQQLAQTALAPPTQPAKPPLATQRTLVIVEDDF